MTYPLQTTLGSTQTDPYSHLVQRIMRIEDITWGQEKQKFLVRYRGQISGESTEAYDRLAESLRPLDVTPLFRIESGRHTVILIKGVIKPKPANPWVNLILIILTLLSVIIVGTLINYAGPDTQEVSQIIPFLIPALKNGLAFALSLVAILGTHEMGHYLAGRYHHTAVTLPYFLPFPLPPFGTLGAFIQLKEIPKNRRILLDIGLAGPLAGLIVAIPILLIGLSLSKIDQLPLILKSGEGLSLEGNSILYLLMKFLVFGQWLPHPVNYGNLPAFLYWLRYFFTSSPIPYGGVDVIIHPMAYAGWAGLLVTSLNLIPAGQLDGGHLVYVLFGEKARKAIPFILIALFGMGFIWPGWWLWAGLVFLFGRVYAEPLDTITQLDSRRKALAILGLIVFILVFTPVPLLGLLGS